MSIIKIHLMKLCSSRKTEPSDKWRRWRNRKIKISVSVMLAFQMKRPATVEPQSVLGFFKKQKSCRITVEGAFFLWNGLTVSEPILQGWWKKCVAHREPDRLTEPHNKLWWKWRWNGDAEDSRTPRGETMPVVYVDCFHTTKETLTSQCGGTEKTARHWVWFTAGL